MEWIRSLVQALTPRERRFFADYIKVYYGANADNYLKLLKLIEKNPEISQEKATRSIYGTTQTKAFSMLKPKFTDRLIDVIAMLPKSVEDEDGEFHQESAWLKKCLIAAHELKRRGFHQLWLEMHEQARDTARTLGLPEYELEALIRLRIHYSNTRDKAFLQVNDEVELALRKYLNDIQALGITDRLKFFRPAQEAADLLAEQLADAEVAYRQTPSPRAEYLLSQARVHYYQLTGQLEKAAAELVLLHDLVTRNARGPVTSRLANISIRQANLALQLNQPEKAIAYAAQALPGTKKSFLNFQVAQIYRMLANFHLNDQAGVRDGIIALKGHEKATEHSFASAICNYFSSAMHLREGDVRGAWRALSDITGLMADKTGWNAAFRIYEIQLLLMMDDADQAALRIDSLRKHSEKYPMDARYDAIAHILFALERQVFEFRPTRRMIELLESLEKDHPWKMASEELIPFHSWYREMEKCNR